MNGMQKHNTSYYIFMVIDVDTHETTSTPNTQKVNSTRNQTVHYFAQLNIHNNHNMYCN